MKNIIKKSIYAGSLLLLFSGIISCEKDFTDLNTTIIKNDVFSTDDIFIDIAIKNKRIDSLKAGNIEIEPGKYLLGVYKNTDYRKVEASLVSQVGISTELKYTTKTYGADTTVVSTIDTVFLKLPYQVTLTENTATGPVYTLESVEGDVERYFTLNLYQSSEYLSRLNPTDPTKENQYYSNEPFQKTGTVLNSAVDYPFIPKVTDTIFRVHRKLSNGNIYATDTIKITSSNNSEVPLPFARIALDKAKFKSIFFDKYESSEFSSQETFNNYFRGLILEATGDEASLIAFDFNQTNPSLNPSIEVYYTNTVVKGESQVLDTIKKSNSFPLRGLRRSVYKMEDKEYPENGQIKIQGTAGSEGSITLFGDDADGNGTPDQLEELRAKNILINDALLTLYIDQSADTTAVPERLHLYKSGTNANGFPVYSQIKDVYTENVLFGGFVKSEDSKKATYSFRITDYISDLISGETDYNPNLNIKVFNESERVLNDTIYKPYNWSPKAITLLNESAANGDKKATLKLSYTKKEN